MLKDRMNNALQIVQNLCMAKSLSVNPEKTSAIVFTRKYKPIKPLRLWGQKLNNNSLVKYLEVYLDFKLRWKEYFENKGKKLHISMWASKKVLSKT